jgi:hypothetical protein
LVEVTFTHWPVFLLTLSGTLSAEDAEAIGNHFDQALNRKERHVNIIDCRGVRERPNAIVRQKLAEYTARSQEASKQWALGTAIVVNNALLRSVITAIHWVAPSPIPVLAVATVSEGVDRCESWLRDKNMRLNADVAAALKRNQG